MARILAVGNATLDIVNITDGYPAEDQEVRACAQSVSRGGNSANTLVALAQLGHHCHWAGTLADEPDGRLILNDLTQHGIDVSAVHMESRGKVPTSYIVLNRLNGSRTIVHYRDLPEYSHTAFSALDLSPFDWLHFEGRNIEETGKMLEHARGVRPELPISIEVEKPRDAIETLFSFADLLLFSRDYAMQHGYSKAEEMLQSLRESAPQAGMTCTWGDKGAYGMTREGELLYAPAFPPPRVLDTLGAGDVFNAGIIDALVRGQRLETALIEASRLAGKKCGIYGLNELI